MKIRHRPTLPTFLAMLCVLTLSFDTIAAGHRGGGFEQRSRSGGGGKDRGSRDFRHMDSDRDKRISRNEWKRRGNFDRLDRDGSGHLDLDEVRQLYGRSLIQYRPNDRFPAAPELPEEIDESALAAVVSVDGFDENTLCAFTRSPSCDPLAPVLRGMLATGLGPRFPKGQHCPGIDDYWALDYSYKRSRAAWHGGIDLPVPWGTPMLAAADGTVIALFSGENSKRGMEVIIRHEPDQTGIPFWTYTGYAHLDALPPFKPGQRIRKGQQIGPTGNSGLSSRGGRTSNRRAAIHFSVMYSQDPNYAISKGSVVPRDGQWMDPLGFYRGRMPFDSQSLKALPESEKSVDIPVILADGNMIPKSSKTVWPYACNLRQLDAPEATDSGSLSFH